jgi:pyruvate,water dikinase
MIITETSSGTNIQEQVGGKGYNLYLLTREGFSVPKWVIISSKVYEVFLNSRGLKNRIHSELTKIGPDTKRTEISLVSNTIQDLIINAPLLVETENEIKKAFQTLGSSLIAVRSSCLEEDSKKLSFAGQFESYLGICSEKEAVLMTKKCWASAFSERSLAYRITNHIIPSVNSISMAVIFQELIEGDKSGVTFTNNPFSGTSSLVIDSVYGLGIGLVNGSIDADHYVTSKEKKNILEKREVLKTTKFKYVPQSHSIQQESVPEKEQSVSSLSDAEIFGLANLGLKIEKFYECPQDIEWTIREKKIYILQSRPITTPEKKQPVGNINIWDNSNIVESYGGLTLPLTFTFARHVYHQVYVQFCEVLMVPKNNIKKMDYFLGNMLGIFYGRIYYNLINWYRLTSILPGFKNNSSFMETMMGTHKSLEKEISDSIRPFQSNNKLHIFLLKTIVGFKFLYFHFTIQEKVDAFQKYFDSIYQPYRKIDYSPLSPEQILTKYRELESKLLYHWKAPIINDFLCMVHFGLLKKLTEKWLPKLGDSVHNDLLCGQGNIESTEPTKALLHITNVARENKELVQILLTTPAQKCMKEIQKPSYSTFNVLIDQYIDRYGFRCMNEMKLEQKDLYQDPSFIFVCIKNYLREDVADFNTYEKHENAIRKNAEKKVSESLNFIKRTIYFWSLHHARQAVRNRENTRFCRTKIYGVVRSMFYSIGKQYAEISIIDRAEDIFYLELNELKGTVEGTLTIQNLKDLILLRKKEYERYTNTELPNRFITEGLVYWNNEYTESNNVSKNSNGNELHGVGCSPGILKGMSKVIFTLNNDTRLDGEILITERTDPGWIPLYPSISGLLIERGSLLSHSAIVAREMGIPTIVGIPNITKIVKNGEKIIMNGKTGVIQIIST